MEHYQFDVISFFTERFEVIWILALIGGVCVIGIVNYLKCWIRNKRAIKWICPFCFSGNCLYSQSAGFPDFNSTIDIMVFNSINSYYCI